ncbi:MAG: sulfite exporter TauE/SafE family protein [Polynucleobacter victoriensis]
MVTSTLFLTIFIGALVSGWHCALMCGGIAAGVERLKSSADAVPLRKISRLTMVFEQLTMHLGRIFTYVTLGTFAGLVGVPIWQQGWLPIQRLLFALAALIFIFQAYRILAQSKGVSSSWELWLNAKTASLWAKLARYISDKSSPKSHFLTGMVWGLVPCGLIYSVLPIAFLSGDPASGALLMLAFGLGTLPNLLLISGFSARLAGWGHQTWARYLAAALMLSTGLFGLYRAFTLPNDLLRGGFCIASTLNYNSYLVG